MPSPLPVRNVLSKVIECSSSSNLEIFRFTALYVACDRNEFMLLLHAMSRTEVFDTIIVHLKIPHIRSLIKGRLLKQFHSVTSIKINRLDSRLILPTINGTPIGSENVMAYVISVSSICASFYSSFSAECSKMLKQEILLRTDKIQV